MLGTSLGTQVAIQSPLLLDAVVLLLSLAGDSSKH